MGAKRSSFYEYVDIDVSDGNVQKTLNIKLYAPEGHIFIMPHGGDPASYTSRKGYKAKPDDIWRKANVEYEKAQALSLKRSDFQRDMKAKKVQLDSDAESLKIDAEMQKMNDEIDSQQRALDKQREAIDSDFSGDPEPSIPENIPDPVKKKPGRPRKVEA